MSDKAIYSVGTVETITDNDKIYVNTGDNIKQVKKSDLFIDINSNLDALEYSEVAGGKQLHDGKIYHFYQSVASPSICNAYNDADSIIFETANLPDIITVNANNSNRNVVCYYDTFPSPGVSSVTNIAEVTSGMPKNITVDKTHKYIFIYLAYGQHVSNVMVNEGSTSVPYEPYIPSVKMLADEVNAQNDSLANFNSPYNLEWQTGCYDMSTGEYDMSIVDYKCSKLKYKKSTLNTLKGFNYSSLTSYLSLYYKGSFVGTYYKDIYHDTNNVETSSELEYDEYAINLYSDIYENDVYFSNLAWMDASISEIKNDLKDVRFYVENGDFIIEHQNGDNISRFIMRSNGTIDAQTLYNGTWKETQLLSR